MNIINLQLDLGLFIIAVLIFNVPPNVPIKNILVLTLNIIVVEVWEPSSERTHHAFIPEI